MKQCHLRLILIMSLGINHVIMANHMISLITSSTTDPSQSINQSILVSKFLSIAKKLISPKKFIHDTSHGFPILVLPFFEMF
jgi:hypothetical protein